MDPLDDFVRSIRTILVPTDFSAPAGRALRTAEQIARHTGARIIVFHAFDDDEYVIGTMSPLTEYLERARNSCSEQLELLAAASRERGARAEARLAKGRPARTIVGAAGESGADLIVLSTHARTGLKRLFLGSVAEAVVRHAPCAVLSLHAHHEVAHRLPEGRGLAAPPLQLRKILFPTDFSPAAHAALAVARDLGQEAGAELTLLHVFAESKFPASSLQHLPQGTVPTPMDVIFRSAQAQIGEQLCELAGEATKRGSLATPMQLVGEPAERICDFAAASHTDLIVLATHGRSSWDRALVGSTTERVMRQAECPVLVVRPHRGEQSPSRG